MMELFKKIKKKKLLSILLIIITISFIIGILFISIIKKDNQELIKTTLDNFFLSIKTTKLNYSSALFSSLTSNLLINFVIWILGISIIGIPLVIIILISKSFVLGFSISSIIYNYKIKGILYSIIYVMPHIINLFITLVIGYYSIKFSCMLFNLLFRKKDYSKRIIVKRYLKLLLYSTILLITSSVIEVYVAPNILKVI